MKPAALPHELLSVAQMGQADRLAMAAGVPFADLMDHAGAAVAEALAARWTPRPVAVLCGPGNNGGDALVAARCLLAAGWPVRLALCTPPSRLPPALQAQAARWSGAFEPVGGGVLDGAELVIDGLFGAGLNRPLQGEYARVLLSARARRLPMVAIDVPSGLDGDTGADGGAVPAQLTVTFFRAKPGHLLGQGPRLCGEIEVCDIGIPDSVLDLIGLDTLLNTATLPVRRLLPRSGALGLALAHGGWTIVRGPAPGPRLDLLAMARHEARQRGCVVLLTGPTPIVADPGGLALIHPLALPDASAEALRATLMPWMAGPARERGLRIWQQLACALQLAFPAW